MSTIEIIHNEIVKAWLAEELNTMKFGHIKVNLKLDREVEIVHNNGGMVFNFTPRSEERLRVFLGMYLK